MAQFNAGNAREMAAKAHEARRRNKDSAIQAAAIESLPSQPLPQGCDSPLAQDLLRAQVELLQELRDCPLAKDKAQIARAMREVREVFHLVTGTPRPGILREKVRKPKAPSFDGIIGVAGSDYPETPFG
jgi:hypothetical protein